MVISRVKTRRSLFGVGAAFSLALLAGVGLVSISPAQAVQLQSTLTPDERSPGLWYTDVLKFDELRAQGATGAGVKIAVIDAAINPDVAELQGANIKVKGSYCAFRDDGDVVPAMSAYVDRSGHGTSVTSMLVGNGVASDGGPGTSGIAPDAEVWFYATGTSEEIVDDGSRQCEKYDPVSQEFYADKGILVDEPGYVAGGVVAYAARNAIWDGADIVVYSGASADIYGWSPTVVEAMRSGVPIVAATPNPTEDLETLLKTSYPYSLNGVVAVSGIDQAAQPISLNGAGSRSSEFAPGSSNLGFVSAAWELLVPASSTAWEAEMSQGTSYATPLVAGTIALGMQKYPDATANQVLQSMVRTTGGSGQHEPEWNGKQFGYGVANPLSMLAVDPTQFPDENPLFVASFDDPRCDYADGYTSDDLENCAWASGPFTSDVWPNGKDAEPTGPGVAPSPETAEWPSWVTPVLWTVGGIILVGVVATAIIVPVVIGRSRKRRLQAPQNEQYGMETYRG